MNPETGHEGLGYFDVCLGGCLFCRSNYSLFFLGAVMITISFVNSTANIANAGLLGAVVVVAFSWGAIWLLLKSVGLLVGYLSGGGVKSDARYHFSRSNPGNYPNFNESRAYWDVKAEGRAGRAVLHTVQNNVNSSRWVRENSPYWRRDGQGNIDYTGEDLTDRGLSVRPLFHIK